MQGLARYDGYEIKTYIHKREDPSSIAHNWVKDLLTDGKGSLWAVTHSGLCRYQSQMDLFDCFKLYTDTEKRHQVHFYAMFEDREGSIWVSTSLGIRLFNAETGRFRAAPKLLTAAIPPTANSTDNFVHEIEQDHDGALWFALENNGLVRYLPSSGELKHFHANGLSAENKLPNNQVREILVDSNNTVWIGSLGGGISRYNRANGTFGSFKHSDNEKAIEIWALYEDAEGIIWIGDGSGLHLYHPETGKVAAYAYLEGTTGGPGNYVARDIVGDSAGGIWVGYFPSGVDQVDMLASKFINYRHKPNDPSSLPDGGVLSTLEADNGMIWVGCGFGLGLLDRSSGTFKRFVHEPGNTGSLSGSTVLDLAKGKDGSIWVGSWNKGLNRLPPGGSKFQHYQYDPSRATSLYGNEPWGILSTRSGELWVVTEKGINRFRPETGDFERVMPQDGDGTLLDSLYSRHIYEDRSGTLWISSFAGLYGLNPKTKRFSHHYKHDPQDPHSLSSDQVLSVFEDSSGHLWVGTNGAGLNLYQPHSDNFKRITSANGLPNMTISGIIEDGNNDLWLTTFHGLVKYSHQHKRFTVFDKHDGPAGDLYNRNSPSLLSTGEIVLGSSRGLTLFAPSDISEYTFVPPVVLTEFSIFNSPVEVKTQGPLQQSITYAKEINLDYQHSVFSFEFAALSYVNPKENQYAYRMKGFEMDWNKVGHRRSATYTNLDPGDYTFQVKASNSSGVWNEKPLEIAVHISPPYWKSPLAYLCYTALAMLLASALIREYQRRLDYERRKLAQERAIVKRLKEIDTLKDEINRNLDKKIAERTEKLQQKQRRLVDAQSELKQLNQKLSEVSVTDQLTGLKNRRFLYQVMHDDIATVNREYLSGFAPGDERNDLTFLLLDLDFFKAINDEYGHKGGDETLIQVSEILRNTMRDTDYVVRWGGEEFVIIIRHLPRQRAIGIAERLRKTIMEHTFSLDGHKGPKQTCSIGIAAYPFCQSHAKVFSWEQVINMADRALYSAKASGRNCWIQIECAGALPHSWEPQSLDKASVNTAIAQGYLKVSSNLALDKLHW